MLCARRHHRRRAVPFAACLTQLEKASAIKGVGVRVDGSVEESGCVYRDLGPGGQGLAIGQGSVADDFALKVH